jgi:hypothetical protein
MNKQLEANLLTQTEELIKLQVLIHSLIDELIENNVITAESLDAKIQTKVKIVTDLIQSQQNEITINTYTEFSKLFNGPIGEA